MMYEVLELVQRLPQLKKRAKPESAVFFKMIQLPFPLLISLRFHFSIQIALRAFCDEFNVSLTQGAQLYLVLSKSQVPTGQVYFFKSE